jgi:6-phosphogluconolactonase
MNAKRSATSNRRKRPFTGIRHKTNFLSVIGLLSLLFASCSQKKEYRLYVGTYSGKNSEGIYCYQFSEETGDLALVAVTPNQENPSFLATSPDEKYLYAVSEMNASPGMDSGSVTAYRIRDSGHLETINREATKGNYPCHVTVSPDGKVVVASNYTSGNLSFYRVGEDGALSESFQQIQHTGSDPNPNRPQAARAHSALFTKDGNTLVAADLGATRIYFYERGDEGLFAPAGQVGMEPGSGPRHFDFSPDGEFIYVMNEMASTVTVLKKDNTAYRIIETVSSLPAGYDGVKAGADIHLSRDGRFVYCSNRGHNSIAVFQRAHDGTITLRENEPAQGDWPRNFALSPGGGFLLVANQRSNNVAVFNIDRRTGELDFTGTSIEAPNPVCLRFLLQPAKRRSRSPSST